MSGEHGRSGEVVIHESDRDGCGMILYLLREGIGQARKAANAHSHAEILALYIASA
jgi:hypothetical protein